LIRSGGRRLFFLHMLIGGVYHGNGLFFREERRMGDGETEESVSGFFLCLGSSKPLPGMMKGKRRRYRNGYRAGEGRAKFLFLHQSIAVVLGDPSVL